MGSLECKKEDGLNILILLFPLKKNQYDFLAENSEPVPV